MKFLTLPLIFLFSYSVAAVAEPAKAAICATCHGKDGNKPLAANYPKINGQNQAYLESAINAYKNGQRTGGMAGIMAAQAKMLSAEEIKELAKHYSSKP